MIQQQDIDFHIEPSAPLNWTETQFMCFSVPEAAISGSVYVLTRPNLGICHSSIMVSQGMSFHPWQVAYADPQMHLSCPERFSNFTLGNGLLMKSTGSVGNYHYQYEGVEGTCEFDLNFSSLMTPFDTHDPAENKLLKTADSIEESTGFGDAWSNGHFDALGRITGSLRLYDRIYQVDCVDGLDRSWGPRSEANMPGVTWLHTTFGEELGIHLVMSLNFENGQVIYGPLRFGYIVDSGERHSAISAHVSAERQHMLGTRITLEIIDARGKEFIITGEAIAVAPWYHFTASAASFNTLYRFECDGQIGYSHVADVFGLNFLARGMGAKGTG
tara:strand:- start:11707 stop:12696 length:990 start_codon:yes stop_codon:yes gene_type:complete